MLCIAGTGITPFGTDQDPSQLVRQAAQAALDDAGMDPEAIDALVVANAAAESFCQIGNVAVWTATETGLVDAPAIRVDTGPSSGLAGLRVAEGLIAAGRADTVLLLGWEAMTRLPTPQATKILGRLMAPDEQAAGLSLPGLVAMLTNAYLERYDIEPRELDRIPVKAHQLASNNPIAQFRDPITLEDVRASRTIAEPIHLLHCAPLTDGAAAAVIAREGPVWLRGLGAATDHHGYTQRRSPPEHFTATRTAAERCYQDAGLSPREVDVIELHDAFSVLEPVGLEDLALAERGKGFAKVAHPDDPLHGRPVVNPSGGLKARGHPIGATGVAQIVECYDQLTGRAANQSDEASIALTHNIGGFGNNVHCALLEART